MKESTDGAMTCELWTFAAVIRTASGTPLPS
jgi:hypothetical protein